MHDFTFWLYFITLAILLTYIVLGFLVAFEGVLAMGGSRFAIRWIRKKFSLEGFVWASRVSYPFFIVVYFLFEQLPYFLGIEKDLTTFCMSDMIMKIFEDEYKL